MCYTKYIIMEPIKWHSMILYISWCKSNWTIKRSSWIFQHFIYWMINITFMSSYIPRSFGHSLFNPIVDRFCRCIETLTIIFPVHNEIIYFTDSMEYGQRTQLLQLLRILKTRNLDCSWKCTAEECMRPKNVPSFHKHALLCIVIFS